MRKLLIIIPLIALAFVACIKSEETTWEKYRDWRELNDAWLVEMQSRTNPDGTPYYQVIVPDWNPGAYVLLHYYNDPAETADKLSPIYTSTVDVRYQLHLYDGTPVDSSDLINQYGKLGIFRTKLTDVIIGWPMALTKMHCGDTVELIVPYDVGYGAMENSTIKPYSNLRFNIRLEDIPYYEQTPLQ
ncbi:MAG: FKBP-type peptidyl-prolyl cis-trans isomerase [Muribaculaceae bacterium]|nr:FKBP-type peptidyl-prolyl cis-trans isomerase [Muribaculaceae bacterium]